MVIIIDSGIVGRQTLNYICRGQLDKGMAGLLGVMKYAGSEQEIEKYGQRFRPNSIIISSHSVLIWQ